MILLTILIIQGLATYYLVTVIQTSELPVRAFNRLILKAEADEGVDSMDEVISLLYGWPQWSWAGGLLGCAACLSFWVGGLTVLISWPAGWPLLRWVGAAGAGLLFRQVHDMIGRTNYVADELAGPPAYMPSRPWPLPANEKEETERLKAEIEKESQLSVSEKLKTVFAESHQATEPPPSGMPRRTPYAYGPFVSSTAVDEKETDKHERAN